LAQAEDEERAVLVLRWMEANGAPPDATHYQGVIEAYEKTSKWDRVHALIEEMHLKGIGPVRDLTRLCTMEVQQAHASASAVDEVLKKYTKYNSLDPPQWTTMLNALAQAEDEEHAVLVLRWMEANGAAPDNAMHYQKVIEAYAKESKWDRVHALIEEIHLKGIGPFLALPRLCTMEMQQAVASASAVDEVLKKYTKYNSLDPPQWAAMLNALAQAEDEERALLVLRWMAANGAAPDAMHYQKMIDACAKGSEWDRVHALMEEMHLKGIGPVKDIARLCAMEMQQAHASASAVDEVLKKYTKYNSLDPPQWAAMLNTLAQAKDEERYYTLLVLRWMEANGASPSAMHYQKVIEAYERRSKWDRVHALIEEMHLKGIGPVRDIARLCTMEVQQAHASASAVDEVLKKYTKYAPLAPLQWAAILAILAQAEVAATLSVSWTEIRRKLSRAVLVLRWMEANGTPPDTIHYKKMIEAYERRSQWGRVHALIEEMHLKGIGPVRDLARLCTTEVQQAHASASAVDEVLKKYAEYPPLAPPQWAAVLNTLAQAKDDERALLVLRWMEANGASPSAMHYQKVIEAYERRSKWDRVHALIEEMHRKGIGPVRDIPRLHAVEVQQAHASASAVDEVLKKYAEYPPLHRRQWTAVLNTLAQAGDEERAVLVLRWMEANGASPNAIQDAILSHFPFYQSRE
jgi:pentatricopeptide repeat protein